MVRKDRFLPGLIVLFLATVAVAGEPDWFTRVKEQGLEKASQVEVERHGRGVLKDSLHVGECYYHLGRFEEGAQVFGRLRRSQDRNYAAAAAARLGEGYFHLGKKDEARRLFLGCIEEHPQAWLDGSIAELCRAWVAKIDGKLRSPDRPAEKPEAGKMDEVKREIDDLSERLRALRELLEELKKKK